MLFTSPKYCGALIAGLMALGMVGCGTQSGGYSSLWPASLFHSAPPAPPASPAPPVSPQTTRRAAPAARTEELGQEQPGNENTEQPPKPSHASSPAPAPESTSEKPRPTVTSSANAVTREEAEAAISQVNKRLALAQGGTPSGADASEIGVVRTLRDNAQQAFAEQDYLTARSLAQKASVLAARLPTSRPSQ